MKKIIKNICKKCEENIHCQGKACAFRSLGNEYCDDIDELINYISQLESNWNELKAWLQERKFVYNITGEDLDEDMSITEVLVKMYEIERKEKNRK